MYDIGVLSSRLSPYLRKRLRKNILAIRGDTHKMGIVN